MSDDQIEYEITLRVTVPAGQPAERALPFEPEFYADCTGAIEVTRAKRLTPGTCYGGPA